MAGSGFLQAYAGFMVVAVLAFLGGVLVVGVSGASAAELGGGGGQVPPPGWPEQMTFTITGGSAAGSYTLPWNGVDGFYEGSGGKVDGQVFPGFSDTAAGVTLWGLAPDFFSTWSGELPVTYDGSGGAQFGTLKMDSVDDPGGVFSGSSVSYGSVPEPAAGALSFLASSLLLCRRRRSGT